MDNIYNFTNRQMCEYATIFPTVASLLDHLLFTIGNGFDVDEKTGMFLSGDTLINEYPEMTDKEWDMLIAECHAKERKFAEQYKHGCVDEEQLAEDCKVYARVSVNDQSFTEDALYADIVAMQQRQLKEFSVDTYHRPYPLSTSFSDIYNLNDNTPRWFIQIALNFCNAWVRFLNDAISNNDVWEPMSQEDLDKSTEYEISIGLLPVGYKKENTKQRDYADMEYTVKHRDMIAALARKFEQRLTSAI